MKLKCKMFFPVEFNKFYIKNETIRNIYYIIETLILREKQDFETK